MFGGCLIQQESVMFGVCLSSTGKCNVWSLFKFNRKVQCLEFV